jgi:hypothetical protein
MQLVKFAGGADGINRRTNEHRHTDTDTVDSTYATADPYPAGDGSDVSNPDCSGVPDIPVYAKANQHTVDAWQRFYSVSHIWQCRLW